MPLYKKGIMDYEYVPLKFYSTTVMEKEIVSLFSDERGYLVCVADKSDSTNTQEHVFLHFHLALGRYLDVVSKLAYNELNK